MSLAGCGFDVISGSALGTTYSVQANCPGALPETRILAELDAVGRQMSSYDRDSELSRFNDAEVGRFVPVSPALVYVADAARRVADQTGGALDVTVAPLVALWGFGAGASEKDPSAGDVRFALAEVGYRRLEHRFDPPALKKLAPLTLDFSAIGKGYAVDRLAEVLDDASCNAYLVELGGEIRVFGRSPAGGAWRLAVESPAGGELRHRLTLREGGVATSGDYRQHRPAPVAAGEEGGGWVSHIIDPRTGFPVAHPLAAVTVVAETALLADAYATALMVLGDEAGLAFADRHGVAALFVSRTASGLAVNRSSAMGAYLNLDPRRMP